MSIGIIVISFLFAIPMTLMWEAPFMNIEKYILFPPKKKNTNRDENVMIKEYKSNDSNHLPADEDTIDSKKKALIP